MRKIAVLVMVVFLISSMSAFGANISIDIDGSPVQFTDTTGYPFLDSNNRTMVPLRVAMEAYGCVVNWDPDTKTATVEKDGVSVVVPIGTNFILVGDKQVANDATAQIVNGKTYLPIRVVLEAVGANVDWDGKTQTVIVKESDSSSMSENGTTGVNGENANNENNVNNENVMSYDEFMSHFDVEIYDDKLEKRRVISTMFKDSENVNDLTAFLKLIPYNTLQKYTIKTLTDNINEEYDEMSMAYFAIATNGYTKVAFNVVGVDIENGRIKEPIDSLWWGELKER